MFVSEPFWVWKTGDDLRVVYREQAKLLREGEVALAVIVQANAELFAKGEEDLPANVIYSPDAGIEDKLPLLTATAEKLYSFKNQRLQGEEEKRFSDLVTDEYKRAMKVPVPESLSEGLEVYFTTIMVHRKHLPDRFLAQNFFPLLVHPEARSALIVPSRYWSEDILSAWKA